MKILIVAGKKQLVKRIVKKLRRAGLDVDGMVVEYRAGDYQTETVLEGSLGDYYLSEGIICTRVFLADVIFLDHDIPHRNGEMLLQYWKSFMDVPSFPHVSKKRIVGLSGSDKQSYYLNKHFKAENLTDAAAVKQFLGIK